MGLQRLLLRLQKSYDAWTAREHNGCGKLGKPRKRYNFNFTFKQTIFKTQHRRRHLMSDLTTTAKINADKKTLHYGQGPKQIKLINSREN